MDLEFTSTDASDVGAIFRFRVSQRGSQTVTGSYRMSGTYDATSRRVNLKATDWIDQPPGYTMVDLSGTIDRTGTTLSGRMLNPSCSTFTVTKT